MVASSPDGGAPAALVSADTQLAEHALETVIEARQRRLELEATLARLAERVGRWHAQPRGGHRSPDPSHLEAAERLARGTPWTEAASNASSGAAGLPRAPAFGLAFSDDLRRAEQWGAAQCRVTHRGREAVAASAALSVGVARLARGERLSVALSEMVAAACRESPRLAARLARALHDADAGVPPAVGLARASAATAADALTMAFFVVRRHPDDLERALREAVMTPGPSSTAAGAVGALLGARLGAGALPPGWLAVLERKDELEARALAAAASR
jgi:poly(ADP-ribose) glycohydrolase ARH3